jgi:hypothetical protein
MASAWRKIITVIGAGEELSHDRDTLREAEAWVQKPGAASVHVKYVDGSGMVKLKLELGDDNIQLPQISVKGSVK